LLLSAATQAVDHILFSFFDKTFLHSSFLNIKFDSLLITHRANEIVNIIFFELLYSTYVIAVKMLFIYVKTISINPSHNISYVVKK